MTISLPDGKYVGAVRDTDPILLSAIGLPPGGSYSWAVAAGPGNGLFGSPSSASTDFTGTDRGELEVHVTYALPGGATCGDKAGLVVIEINDLTGPVTPQFMDQIDVPNGQYIIPYSAAEGELRAVLVSPVIDPDYPYQWETDFRVRVDHQTGDASVTLLRSGPYLFKTIREDQGGNSTETLFKLYYNSWVIPKGKTKTGRDRRRRRRPDPHLVLISTATNDDGSLKAAREFFPRYEDMDSVADANAKIMAAFIANNRQPISVSIVDHGNKAIQGMGDGRGSEACKHISNQLPDAFHVRDFADICRTTRVTEVTFYGCNVAEPPEGEAWIQSLADLIGGNVAITACTGEITWTKQYRPVPDVYYDIEEGSDFITKRPRP